MNNTSPCNDGNACTANDACANGTCVGGGAVNCDDGNACTDDDCNPAAGCIHRSNDANACSDGDVCTTGDHCSAGFCIGIPLPELDEIWGLMLSGKSATALTWADQGTEVVYDVAGGFVGDIAASGGTSAAQCVADNVPVSAWIDARPKPAANEGYYYLVRVQNACRTGTYGYASTGVERRPTVDCP